MTEKKLNLYEKIQAVSNDVRNIEKGMIVGSGSYQYKAVQDIDVTLAVKDAETKHRIVSIPIKQEIVNSEVIRTLKKDNGGESLTYVDTIKMTVKIIDLDDITQFVEIESFGKGIDSGDKGFGKASTYARKYALLNAYKIATGEDPDKEASAPQTVALTISEKRLAITNYLNTDSAKLKDVLAHFSIGDLTDLTEKQIGDIYTTYKTRKWL